MLTQWPALACAPLYRCPSESTSENVLYQGCCLSGCLQTDTRPSALLPSTQTQLLGSIPAPAIWRRNKGPSPHPPPGCQEETGESWHSLSPSEARRMEEAARSSSSDRQLLLSGCWGSMKPFIHSPNMYWALAHVKPWTGPVSEDWMGEDTTPGL